MRQTGLYQKPLVEALANRASEVQIVLARVQFPPSSSDQAK